jgi:hypothetical protein
MQTTNNNETHNHTTNTMSPNSIPHNPDDLEVTANRAESGARRHGVAIGIKQNTANDIEHDKEAVFGKPQDPLNPDPNAPIGKRAEYAQARSRASDARAGLRSALDTGSEFCVNATNVLKPHLGYRWNAKWRAAGFVSGSLRQPADPVPRLGLFRAYLRLHPEHENAPLEITAAKADSILAAIDTAQSLSDTNAALEATAKQERDEAVRKLRRRLTALRNELTLLLGVDDPRWYQFGFNRPADGRIPSNVEGLTVASTGAGTLQVRWEASSLAENYRVTRQVQGVDLQPVDVGLFSDLLAIVTGLPSGATVIIRVSARNNAGETVPAEKSIIVS